MELETSRFWGRVQVAGVDDCWEWQAGRGGHGYGVFYGDDKKAVLAHRWALMSVEDMPYPGAHALHDCDNRRCVNPSHLHWGTHVDNMREAAERGRSKPGRTLPEACPQGHEYTDENTITKTKPGRHGKTYIVHSCRQCNTDYLAERRRKNKKEIL